VLGDGDPVGDAELLGVGDLVGDAGHAGDGFGGVGDGDQLDGVIGRTGDVAAGAGAVTGVDGVTGRCDGEGEGCLEEGARVALVLAGLALVLPECL
jgi:hypothetical protein